MPAPPMLQSIIVFHAAYDLPRECREALAGFDAGALAAAVRSVKAINGYVPVAQISFEPARSIEGNLETAWRLMQNGVVSESWTLSPPAGLKPLIGPIDEGGEAYGHRSSAIGDLYEIGGNQYVVAATGFLKV